MNQTALFFEIKRLAKQVSLACPLQMQRAVERAC
jgi:hypothetical protein